MKKIILGLILFTGVANAKPIEVEQLTTEIRSYECGELCSFRHSFLSEDQPIKYTLLQDTKVRVLDYIIMENRFFFDGNDKVKFAGLEYRLGIEIPIKTTSSIEVGKWHHSSHAIDKEVRGGEFPLQDGIYVRFNWIKK